MEKGVESEIHWTGLEAQVFAVAVGWVKDGLKKEAWGICTHPTIQLSNSLKATIKLASFFFFLTGCLH